MRTLLYFLVFLSPTLVDAQVVNNQAPDLTIPSSLARWQEKRSPIRETLLSLMGDLPPIPAQPEVRLVSTEDKGSYILERFTFENGAGATVPGVFLTPKNGKSIHPAIYYCHWHGGNYDLGKGELFSTHHTPEIPAQTLTGLGFAVIAIDAYCFGERSGQGPGGPDEKGSSEELTSSKLQLWLGRSLWGMMVRDDLIALNYLFSRPDVDKTNVAATGISMGATRTWWLMALDERIKTGVAVGCLTRYQDLIAEQKLKYHGIYYYVPGMLKHFDTEAIVSLIAPRPVLFMTGDSDPGSPLKGIVKIENIVKQVYTLYNSGGNFKSIIYPDTGHVYTDDMWANMRQWMSKHLE